MPAVMPGTTSNGIPAARSTSASSPPRPNTNGSPPLSRTTVRPPAPYRTSSRSISCLGHLRAAALLAHVDELGAGARAVERARPDQPVVQDHVGLRDQLGARTVSSPGSPGPAPTR